ncbi:hypothetical protein ACFW04_013581 [Cataglyphis niger]
MRGSGWADFRSLASQPNSKAAIAVKGLEVQLMSEFCDVAAIMMDLRRSNTDETRKEMYCHVKRLPLIIGYDVNAHHTVWRSTNINDRGRRLLEYLMATELEILNRGNKPTFQNVVRREVLDLTLCSRNLVSEIPSLSDHRQIVFRLANVRPEAIYRRNPRRTDWDSFREDLSTGLCEFPKRTSVGMELCVDDLQRALMGSFEKNYPAVRSNKRVSW